ncbi:uncharacterized protein LOC105188938 [Harpegnathos saltator]|uniref:Suppressor of cytokine signaling 2 n=1 Tax=Harpegnathos saltator TaxID=610380 RepID=E2C1J5_HARSA|nr:uncharacterized protein LOC105188938 [Harpegnathos saltator]XP_011148968.1 uncharacterized protein LOC105188938 [Harpegnathos saltator]EFN78171.1 Suppressor of cytokine signaling 2 [Harpegnathos saltator]
MLTVMCPNCRHRFRTARCCEPAGGRGGGGGGTSSSSCGQRKEEEEEEEMLDVEARAAVNDDFPTTTTTTTAATTAAACYVGGLLVPHGYTSGDGAFINAPTIVHGPAAVFQPGMAHCAPTVGIVNPDVSAMADHEAPAARLSGAVPRAQTFARQSPCHATSSLLRSRTSPLNVDDPPSSVIMANYGIATASERHVATKCELTDSTVTISTPGIQSGGYLIQSTETGILVQAPKASIEIRPKLNNDAGCLVQDRSSSEDERLAVSSRYNTEANNIHHRTLVAPPSGCSELPGCRRTLSSRITAENNETMESRQRKIPCSIRTNGCRCCGDHGDGGTTQNLCQCHGRPYDASPLENNSLHNSLLVEPVGGGGVQIQVNATLQLPASLGQCKVNITATTAALPASNRMIATESRVRNNFNGGGIVQPDEIVSNNERSDGTPTTPVSWLMPYPWNLDLLDKDINRLCEVKRLLQICGWYHEGISWQQSENLLKNAPVGRWLMRDSSDSRYTFAVSVQTNRGPTSVRVHYFLERFRLDAEPRLVLAMPLFDCPIRMLEYYVEYSKRMDEHRREVWVDYSGQLYSQIYLTKPLVKEVRSLSHLARLAVHRNKLPTDNLPLSIKNYLAEYPYTL